MLSQLCPNMCLTRVVAERSLEAREELNIHANSFLNICVGTANMALLGWATLDGGFTYHVFHH